MVTVEDLLDRALMSTHHLANLTNAPEVHQARRHLLNAQHSTERMNTLEYLEEAIKLLMIGRMENPNYETQFDRALQTILLAHDSV